MRKVSPRYGRILILCLVMAALTSVLHRRGRLEGLELRSIDWRFVQRGSRPVRDDIVIVAIDEKSLSDLEAGLTYDAAGHTFRYKFPWPLDVHAQLVNVLRAAGARTIAFDLLLSEGDARFSQGQEKLAQAIRTSGNVFLAASYAPAEVRTGQTPGGGLAEFGARSVTPERLDALDYVYRKLPKRPGKPPPWLGQATKPEFWTLPLHSLLRSARGFGSIDIPTMVDGVYRAVEPVVSVDVKGDSGEACYQLYPHLALAVAADYQGVPLKEIGVEREPRVRLGEKGMIPVRPAEGKDTQATLLIDYAPTSPESAPFPVYPYSSVLEMGLPAGKAGASTGLSPAEFKDKIVLVGATAKGLGDIRMNPYSAATAGVETQAHILDTILQRRFLQETGEPFLWGVLVAFGLALGGLLSLASMRIGTTLTALLAALSIGGAVVAFDRLLLVVPLMTPLFQIGISYTAVMAYRFATEEWGHRRVRRFFELYVSAPVAELILNDPRAQELGGTRAEITALFADIRGFTSMSERLPPEAVVRILNEYFDAMVGVVDRHQGTLDKFIGDELMLLFNAPLRQPDHAPRAVETGLDMLATLAELRRRWEEQGLPPVEIGVGVCTGMAVVGNVGSRRRHQYTAIGDPVNTAARLQALNKELGTRLLISQSTYDQLNGAFEVRRMPPVEIRGKEEQIGVYEVVGTRTEAGVEVLRC